MRILCAALASLVWLGCAKHDVATDGGGTPDAATVDPAAEPPRLENTLKDAPTAYLRRSAGQPIPWLQWGPSVGQLARSSGRLLLLSVGADWCAACRQMDEHTFGHPSTIKIINEAYIPVKIDADARSDVDARLQQMARVMARSSGYPLTMVVSPDGVPLFAANALGPVADGDLASLAQTLTALAADWRASSTLLLASGQASAKALLHPPQRPLPTSAETLWMAPLKAFAEAFDGQHGGLRNAPRIPTPRLYSLAIHAGREWQDLQSLDRATQTLTILCQRGIRDVVGGGFYRSARDEDWMRPSFDRHAADNALMLDALLDAYAATQSSLMKSCAQGVLQFVADELVVTTERAREKGPRDILFASHIPPVVNTTQPGELLTFTTTEVLQTLPDNVAHVAVSAFGIVPRPELIPGFPLRNVAYLSPNASRFREDEVDAARKGLAQIRVQQGRPPADPVSYAAPTGMLIRAMLAAAPTLGMAAPRLLALEVLNAWLRQGYRRGGGFSHAIHTRNGPMGTGTLLDQASMLRALVLAYEQTGDLNYLAAAVDTADVVGRAYGRPDGGLVDSIAESWEPELLRLRGSAAFDSEMPSPSAEMALALVEIADALGRTDARERAGKVLAAVAGDALTSGPFGASVGLAAWRLTHPAIRVLVLDKLAGKGTVALTDAGLAPRRVGTTVQHIAQVQDGGTPGRPRAVVCVGAQCGQPSEDPVAIRNDVVASRAPAQ